MNIGLDSRKNIIILTGGLAGSSVLTSMFATKGYWVGDQTMKKSDYNTWENSELVSLNKKIINDVDFNEDWVMEFRADYVDQIASGFSSIDPGPFIAFVDRCNRNTPWIWKDPRLWLTIRYWRQFLDFSNTVFLIIRREPLQSWISTTIRRQIQTRGHAIRYDDGIHQTIMDFVGENDANYLGFLYEDLITDPERVLADINKVTGSSLVLKDFSSVFRGRLYKKQHGLRNFLLASAIYLKNYSQRHR